ncbi:biotin--[acetyl-CoA-carboxylase] ligase [Bifidobacterium asteroides]|uniref:biotin--[acetyl-CoA-carboxylase] ligase n=1 Tax=Bifidobacterium asteroides TaxID=1684 RepID=UPI0027417180|nr:hypothetical protein [Bifidobacterium asteroides]WLT10473.1 hypothetical protein RAM15_07170 [Bifidobacterium asteroides]
MPHQNIKWQPSASLDSGVLSSIVVLDTVDSTNTLVAHALEASTYSDARDRVERLFGGGESTTSTETVKGLAFGTRGKAEDTPRKNARQGVSTTTRYEGRVASKGIRRWPGAGGSTMPLSVAVADAQSRCRGRLARTWVNQPRCSLLATWALPLPTGLLTGPFGGWMPMVAGLAALEGLQDVLEYHGCRLADGGAPERVLTLKWPNDLFCRGAKLGGILCELVRVDQDWSALAVGIGINLFLPRQALPIAESTSLQFHYRDLPDYQALRDDLVDAISWHLSGEMAPLGIDGSLDRALNGPQGLRSRIAALSWTLGRRVRVVPVAGEPVDGRALEINPDASLRVRLPDGSQVDVSTADVGVLPEVAVVGA